MIFNHDASAPWFFHVHKAAILPERSTINLEFRASGVTLIGVLIANGKAQAVSGLASTGLHQVFKQLVGDN